MTILVQSNPIRAIFTYINTHMRNNQENKQTEQARTFFLQYWGAWQHGLNLLTINVYIWKCIKYAQIKFKHESIASLPPPSILFSFCYILLY